MGWYEDRAGQRVIVHADSVNGLSNSLAEGEGLRLTDVQGAYVPLSPRAQTAPDVQRTGMLS
jgi:hypothetical protein